MDPGPTDQLAVAAPSTATPGTPFSFTVTAEDFEGNTTPDYAKKVHFTSTDAAASLPSDSTLTNGVGTFSATLNTLGIQTIKATDVTDSSIKGTSGTIDVMLSPPVLSASFTPDVVPVGGSGTTTFTVTITNPNSSTLTGIGFSNVFPAGLVFDSAGTGLGICEGGENINPPSYVISNVTLAAGASCIVPIVMHASQAREIIDTTSTVFSDQTNPGPTASATLYAAGNLVVNVTTDDAGDAGNCSVQPTPATTTNADSCSLRDALLEATNLGSGSITFDSGVFGSTQTITLTHGTLNIPSNTTITGATTGSGATLTNLVTVSGGGPSSNFPVFNVNSSATNTEIANLIITNGYGSTSAAGGITNGYQSALTVMNSAINGNSASASAGGIFNDFNATLTVIDSTISGNMGAAIINESGGTVAITSSTISGNSGTGIANGGSAVTINGSTISGNTGGYSGGGINTSAGTVTLANTIVAGNIATSSPDIAGAYTDNGGNIVGGVNGVTATNVNLAPLASYGGPTQTMIPEPGSPAICAGVASIIPAGITTDQRGFPNTNTTYPGYSTTPCVDTGAVQTNYAISFTTQPPYAVVEGVTFSPAPVVSLTESGAPILVSGGTVTVSDSASLLAGTLSEPITSGAATFSNLDIPTTTVKDYLNATLALTSSINLTTQATNRITVSLHPQFISFGALSNLTYGAAPFTVSATATSGLPVSFGTITTPVCTVSGATVTLVAQGLCTIKASQAGNDSYSAATNVYQSFTVHGEAQTITFPAPSSTPLSSGSVTLNATASSGLPVSYASTTNSVCTVSANTVTLVAAGTCIIEAKQPGNSDYDPAASVTQSFNVTAN